MPEPQVKYREKDIPGLGTVYIPEGMDDSIANELINTQLKSLQKEPYKPEGAIATAFNKPVPGVISAVPEERRITSFPQILAHYINAARPLAAGLATGGALRAAQGLSPAISAGAGTLAGLGTDYAMQLGGGDPGSVGGELYGTPKGSIQDRLAAAAELNVGNEFINRIGSKVFNTFMNLVKPSPINPYYAEFLKEGGGASQSQYPGAGKVSKVIEDIAAPGAKAEQLSEAAQAGKRIGIRKTFNLLGEPNQGSFLEPQEYPIKLKGTLGEAKNQLVDLSNAAAKRAENIAKLNVIGTGGRVPTRVEGPTNLSNSVQLADQFLQSLDPNYRKTGSVELLKIVEDSKKPLVRTAFEILDYAKRDNQGNIIGTKPMSFRKAWDLKQAAADIGYTGNDLVPSYKKAQFRSLSDAIDNDIETSIQGWRTGSSDALNHYQEAKTLVSNRIQIFNQGDDVTKILTGKDSGLDEVKGILKDPERLGRAIGSDFFTRQPGGARKTLGAYQFQEILQDSWDVDKNTFNRDQLIKRWNDPEKQAIFNKLYNAEQKKDIGNFIETLSNVSQKQGMAGAVGAAIRVGYNAFYLTGAIATGALVGGSKGALTSGGIVGAAVATNTYAKAVMLNPKIARLTNILMNSPPNSNLSNLGLRTVMGALEGATVLAVMDDGSTKPATVADGKIVPKD